MATKVKKVVKCDNCGDVIYEDQPRNVVKSIRKSRGVTVFHTDHTGCVESLRRRNERGNNAKTF